ncbi:MAG: hypothetical protein AAGL17_10215 [Cyanobacteria bacterium J06576_12]
MMDFQSLVATILNDRRLTDDGADKKQLIAEYGTDNKPEAIYLLADKYGWRQLYDLLVQILRDDQQAEHWETAQIVLFYAAGDHKHKMRQCPMPADSTIALLYHRFPNGIDDGDRIWAIVCDLKGVNNWSDYDPMQDTDVLGELETLKCA